MTLRIARWSGQPGVASLLARWHVREWANVFPGWTEPMAVQEFHAQLAHTQLPATWLAFKGDVLIGSISALLEDSPELNDIAGPWLASFYIVPEARGNGAAQALMTAAAQGVRTLGYSQWRLFTPHHQAYYAKHGWKLLEYRELHGERVAVMAQALK
jgi:GNAT superfamily N-acetyltransferase